MDRFRWTVPSAKRLPLFCINSCPKPDCEPISTSGCVHPFRSLARKTDIQMQRFRFFVLVGGEIYRRGNISPGKASDPTRGILQRPRNRVRGFGLLAHLKPSPSRENEKCRAQRIVANPRGCRAARGWKGVGTGGIPNEGGSFVMRLHRKFERRISFYARVPVTSRIIRRRPAEADNDVEGC